MAILIDSYSESNQDEWFYLDNGGTMYSKIIAGQSFANSISGTLDSCKFYLISLGNPSGNVVAKLYAHTGTYGDGSTGKL